MSPRTDTLSSHEANERTMLAWIRTGISLMGFGFAIARFGLYLRESSLEAHVDPPTVAGRAVGSGWIGALLVAIGMLTNLAATFRYRRARAAIERGDLAARGALLPYAISTTTALIGLVMVVLLLRALSE